MNLKIKIGSLRTAIALPLEHAALVATLLQHGKIVHQEGYGENDPWLPTPEGLTILTTDDTPEDPRIAAAKKEAEDKSSMWYREYNKNQELTKELAQLKVALDTLKGQVTCTVDPVAAPIPEEPF